jgi:hypothetical protein
MKATTISMLVLNAIVILPIGELLRFHVMLACYGMTTF